MRTHEQEEVLAFAQEWYEVATSGRPLPDNPFFRFVALWIGFNGLCSATFPAARTDAAQIRSFGNWSKARIAHDEALGDVAYATAVGVLQDGGVYNFREGALKQMENRENVAEVIDLVYLIRCNLFHARKVPANLRDRRLVEAARIVVSGLMERLIKTRESAYSQAV